MFTKSQVLRGLIASCRKLRLEYGPIMVGVLSQGATMQRIPVIGVKALCAASFILILGSHRMFAAENTIQVPAGAKAQFKETPPS